MNLATFASKIKFKQVKKKPTLARQHLHDIET